MKQPTKLMRAALRGCIHWNRSYMGKTEVEGLTWINLTGTAKVGIPEIVPIIGESVSWHLGADKDGNAVRIYEEDDETVRKFYART